MDKDNAPKRTLPIPFWSKLTHQRAEIDLAMDQVWSLDGDAEAQIRWLATLTRECESLAQRSRAASAMVRQLAAEGRRKKR